MSNTTPTYFITMDSKGSTKSDYDLVVIGAGINGAGIARDAVGRGLKVLLCEKDDIAEHTSSASTKLIHGGLRYLEHYDFKLVRHALKEREVLLRAAPHIIWPLRFILPHHKDLRPRWLIRLGLFIYDHIGGRKILPASNSVNLRTHVAGEALKNQYTSGFEYSDCWVQDSRLVVLNVMDASEKGCAVLTRTEETDLHRNPKHWSVTLFEKESGQTRNVTTTAVVNAAGPWVEKTLSLDEKHEIKHGIRLVKGSHVVVPEIFGHPYTYIFQNADNRIIFAVPYENKYTLLGTTNVEVEGQPGEQTTEGWEVSYICETASVYFDKEINPEDAVWAYTGVRPLYDDASTNASKVTRDYKLDLDTKSGAPILSVYGGKLTTYRKLSEDALDMLTPVLGVKNPAWTFSAVLPGGDIVDANYDAFVSQMGEQFPWLDVDVLNDYTRNYGTRMTLLIGSAESINDLGADFSGGLFQCEVDYLMRNEWAKEVEDILWRRSKKGLVINEEGISRLEEYMTAKKNTVLANTDDELSLANREELISRSIN
ncbi:MAG: glycerol-3-phosphate dehydrogenase [Granulosicoccaceae bacterium]